MSSITLSERVRPKTSGTAEPDLDAALLELPSDKPLSGMVREGILDDGRPENGGFSYFVVRNSGWFWLAATTMGG